MDVKLGNRIKEIRLSKGITQSFIARKLKKTNGWLSNIEKGERGIDARELKQIADIIGVPIECFFKQRSSTKRVMG